MRLAFPWVPDHYHCLSLRLSPHGRDAAEGLFPAFSPVRGAPRRFVAGVNRDRLPSPAGGSTILSGGRDRSDRPFGGEKVYAMRQSIDDYTR